jgi:hypothetical protein
MSATFENGDNVVNVSLSGAAGSGGSAGGLGALGGLFGGLAQSAIQQSGQQVTVAGLPATVQPDGTLVVPLQDGSILTFSVSNPPVNSAAAALAVLGELVNDFPVADINAALQ